MKKLMETALTDRVRGLDDTLFPAQDGKNLAEVSSSVLAAVEEALLAGETHYTVRPGIPVLRKRLGREILRLGGPSCESLDNILITTSESEALFVALLGLRPDPPSILVGDYSHCRYQTLFRVLGYTTESISDDEDRSRNGIIYRVWTGEEQSVDSHNLLLRIAIDRNLPDILDLHETLGLRSLTSFPPYSPNHTILVGNLNTLPGMGSFRVAFLMGPEPWVSRCRPWKQAFSICTAAPSQRAALAALDQFDKGTQ